jgi:hypothetical protein
MAAPAHVRWSLGQSACLALTQPSALWREPSAALIRNGLLAQWLVLALGKLLALPETRDLQRLTGTGATTDTRLSDILILCIGSALTVLAANAILAVALWLLLALLGRQVAYEQLLGITAIALLPLWLGRAVGEALLALSMPLSHTPTEIWAWRLWPFSAGLATWLPHAPAALSLTWAFACVFDVFGAWSLWLLFTGLRDSEAMPKPLQAWVAALLVLLCCAVALGLWQTGQFWLARTT